MSYIATPRAGMALLSVAFALVGLVACGGGGGGGGGGEDAGPSAGTPAPAAGPAPAPEPPPPAPAPAAQIANRVLLFAATSSSSSQYLPKYDITLSSSGQQVWQVSPGDAKAELMASNASPSYAPSTIAAFVSGSRLFLFHEHPDVDRHSLVERDLLGTGAAAQIFVSAASSFRSGCNAVVGDHYFYRESPAFDPIRGTSGGGFFRYTISTKQNERLAESADRENNCFGHLSVSGGALVDVRFDRDAQRATLVRRDLATGRPGQVIAEFAEPQSADYASYRFAVDDDGFYLARTRTSSSEIEVWRYPLNTPTGATWQRIHSAAIDGFTPTWLRASGGRLALADQSGRILLFDAAAGSAEMIDLGARIYDVALLFLRQ